MHNSVKLAVITALALAGCKSHPPEFGPKDIASLQKLADEACSCRRGSMNGQTQKAPSPSCSGPFDKAIAKAGSEEAISVPEGPLTARILYVGPTARGYDSLETSGRPEPPYVVVERPFGACTQDEEDAGYRKLRACQKRKGYGPEEDGRCWSEFYP